MRLLVLLLACTRAPVAPPPPVDVHPAPDGDHRFLRPPRAPLGFAGATVVVGDGGVTLLGPDRAARATLQPLGLPSPNVTALAVGEDALYVGSDGGLVAVRRDQGTLSIDPVDGLTDTPIDALAVRRDRDVEELWAGTSRGAVRIREGALTHFIVSDGLPDDHVVGFVTSDENVRILTAGGCVELAPTGALEPVRDCGGPRKSLL